MANHLSQQSLCFVRPSATSFVCWGRQWSNALCFRHQKLAVSTLRSTGNSSPWLLLPAAPASESNGKKMHEKAGTSPMVVVHKFYSLAEKRVITISKKSPEPDVDAYCVGSSYGWVGFINKRPSFDFFILNPMTGRSIKLPPIRTLGVPDDNSFWYIPRFVMSSPNPDAEDCRVLVHYKPVNDPDGPAWDDTSLAFCSPGQGDGDIEASSWTLLDSPLGLYSHIVYSPKDQRFFAMDLAFRIESWDLSDPSNPVRYPPAGIEEKDEEAIWDHVGPCLGELKAAAGLNRRGCEYYFKSYLVPDSSMSGPLFLIHRFIEYEVREGYIRTDDNDNLLYRHKTRLFHVYKIDTTTGGKWTLKYMDSLDDRAFFIGLNGGFVLSAEERPELKPNSIYFTDDLNYGPSFEYEIYGSDYDDYKDSRYGGHDIGIYNYEDQSIEECYHAFDSNRFDKIQPNPVWFTPNCSAT